MTRGRVLSLMGAPRLHLSYASGKHPRAGLVAKGTKRRGWGGLELPPVPTGAQLEAESVTQGQRCIPQETPEGWALGASGWVTMQSPAPALAPASPFLSLSPKPLSGSSRR